MELAYFILLVFIAFMAGACWDELRAIRNRLESNDDGAGRG